MCGVRLLTPVQCYRESTRIIDDISVNDDLIEIIVE
jgi:hypothetical protein